MNERSVVLEREADGRMEMRENDVGILWPAREDGVAGAIRSPI